LGAFAVLFTAFNTTLAIENKASFGLDAYFEYLEKYPLVGLTGNSKKGEIEIIRDKQKISEIEKISGCPVGIMFRNKYWVWLNDAVQFPNQKYGVYGRMLSARNPNGDNCGVAVMAILPNGKIALNRNFRHATRTWEYELPRGGVEPNETIEQAAAREVKEETGMVIKDLQMLGKMATDSGVVNSIVPIFLAKVGGQQQSSPEDGEAIAAIDTFSIEEIKKGLVDGYLSIKIYGKINKIHLRDPYLAYGVLLYELRGI